jgi:hypothetical protein
VLGEPDLRGQLTQGSLFQEFEVSYLQMDKVFLVPRGNVGKVFIRIENNACI